MSPCIILYYIILYVPVVISRCVHTYHNGGVVLLYEDTVRKYNSIILRVRAITSSQMRYETIVYVLMYTCRGIMAFQYVKLYVRLEKYAIFKIFHFIKIYEMLVSLFLYCIKYCTHSGL